MEESIEPGKLEFLSFNKNKVPKEVILFLVKNKLETYKDTCLKEHLYSINLLEDLSDLQIKTPKLVREWLENLMVKFPNAVYFRFEY